MNLSTDTLMNQNMYNGLADNTSGLFVYEPLQNLKELINKRRESMRVIKKP